MVSPTWSRFRSILTRRCGSTTRRSLGSRSTSGRATADRRDRYYIHKTRPFLRGGRIYYEVTFYRAVNQVSKFDRVIAFTDIDMTDKYSAMLTLQVATIEVFDQQMPITIIRSGRFPSAPASSTTSPAFWVTDHVRTNSAEYRYLMGGLTAGSGSLLDLIDA